MRSQVAQSIIPGQPGPPPSGSMRSLGQRSIISALVRRPRTSPRISDVGVHASQPPPFTAPPPQPALAASRQGRRHQAAPPSPTSAAAAASAARTRCWRTRALARCLALPSSLRGTPRPGAPEAAGASSDDDEPSQPSGGAPPPPAGHGVAAAESASPPPPRAATACTAQSQGASLKEGGEGATARAACQAGTPLSILSWPSGPGLSFLRWTHSPFSVTVLMLFVPGMLSGFCVTHDMPSVLAFFGRGT